MFEQLVGQAVDLDIHLAGGDAIFRTREFEVHIAQGVFIAEDIGEDNRIFTIGDHTHCDT